jgi:hypothetical protein
MSSSTVTIVSTLAAGGVGVCSAVLSYRMAGRQVGTMERENEATRKHSESLLSLQRRLDAVERLWRLLWQLEVDGALTSGQQDEYIRSLVWMPVDVQKSALEVLRESKCGSVPQSQINAFRDRLIALTGVTVK